MPCEESRWDKGLKTAPAGGAGYRNLARDETRSRRIRAAGPLKFCLTAPQGFPIHPGFPAAGVESGGLGPSCPAGRGQSLSDGIFKAEC